MNQGFFMSGGGLSSRCMNQGFATGWLTGCLSWVGLQSRAMNQGFRGGFIVNTSLRKTVGVYPLPPKAGTDCKRVAGGVALDVLFNGDTVLFKAIFKGFHVLVLRRHDDGLKRLPGWKQKTRREE